MRELCPACEGRGMIENPNFEEEKDDTTNECRLLEHTIH